MSGADDPEEVDALVPEGFSVTVRRRDEGRLAPFELDELRGRQVEVYANGFRYRGALQGADERDLYLKGLTRWWVIPLERIASLRPVDDPAEGEERG